MVLDSDVELQPLLVRPHHFGDRISAFFGDKDLNFESAEFSQRYHVSADDRRWAYDVLHNRVIEQLLEASPYVIELGGHFLMIHHPEMKDRPETIHAAIRVGAVLLGRLPDYVRQQQEAEEAHTPPAPSRSVA